MAAFQEALPALERTGVSVVAISTDPAGPARETVGRLGLTFPVGYGLPLVDTAERLGAYYETRRGILHATGFLVRPDGTISIVVYSSGPIGRLHPDNVVRAAAHYQEKSR